MRLISLKIWCFKHRIFDWLFVFYSDCEIVLMILIWKLNGWYIYTFCCMYSFFFTNKLSLCLYLYSQFPDHYFESNIKTYITKPSLHKAKIPNLQFTRNNRRKATIREMQQHQTNNKKNNKSSNKSFSLYFII